MNLLKLRTLNMIASYKLNNQYFFCFYLFCFLFCRFAVVVLYCFFGRFSSCCWISTLRIGADGGWDLTVRGSLVPRSNGRINSSPVTSSTLILRLQEGCNHQYKIPGSKAFTFLLLF